MTPSQSEALQQLLLACARQDREAFARLYRTTSPKLYGVALRILKRADRAEEILQECYVSIWMHAATYAAGRAAPMTWMTSIVRNRCLDALRRPNPEVVLQATDADDAASSTEAMCVDEPVEQATDLGLHERRGLLVALAALRQALEGHRLAPGDRHRAEGAGLPRLRPVDRDRDDWRVLLQRDHGRAGLHEARNAGALTRALDEQAERVPVGDDDFR